MTNNPIMPDLWTNSPLYADLYQSDQQIRTVCDLLELSSAASMADIGCGNGAFTVHAATQFPDCSFHAFDCLSSAVGETRKRAASAGLKNLRAEKALAVDLPLQDHSVDRILMRNVLHHLDSLDVAMAEVSRILAPGGLVLLETPSNPGDSTFGEFISDIFMLMDSSHRRTFHIPQAIADVMVHHGITAAQPDCWPCPYLVNSGQIDLIRRRNAEDRLSLDESCKNGAAIQLMITRIIGRKEDKKTRFCGVRP